MMGKKTNHSRINTELKPVSYSYAYEPRPIHQNLDSLSAVEIDSEDPDFPEWMRSHLKLVGENLA